MNKEDKELLLRDLCARLPYGVKLQKSNEQNVIVDLYAVNLNNYTIDFYTYKGKSLTIGNTSKLARFGILLYKPCLFPLSSMTEEQKKEYYSLADDVTIKPGQGSYLGIKIHCIKLGISDNPHEEVWDYIDLGALDWLNKNHFDYRGLIEKGLAIDATGLNIY